MITKKSLRKLDSVGYLGTQKKLSHSEFVLELRKSSEAMKSYKAKHRKVKTAV